MPDIWMTPDDAGTTAGGIQQNQIKRHLIPPAIAVEKIGRYYFCGQPQAGQVLLDCLAARGQVQGGERVEVRKLFQQMSGLSARCRASVQDTCSRNRCAKQRSHLGCCVLNRHHPVFESKEILDMDRCFKGDTPWAQGTGTCPDAMTVQKTQVIVA